MKRRNFMIMSGLGVGGLMIPPMTPVSPLRAKPRMALQLWTVRDLIEKDLETTIEQVAHIGYSAVETAFFPKEISLERSASVIERSGMAVCSIHADLPIGDNKNKVLEMAEAYRSKRIVWHGWPEDERYKTISGIEELVKIYNESNAFFKENNLEFGLHNHWWEFRKLPDGKLPFNILKETVDPDIFFEIDTYWTKVAGQDPARIVGQFGDRAPLLHIKDGPARFTSSLENGEPEPMVAVGQGSQNFPEIAKSNDSIEWMIVELDNCATDMMTAVTESYQYLQKMKLAKGRI